MHAFSKHCRLGHIIMYILAETIRPEVMGSKVDQDHKLSRIWRPDFFFFFFFFQHCTIFYFFSFGVHLFVA